MFATVAVTRRDRTWKAVLVGVDAFPASREWWCCRVDVYTHVMYYGVLPNSLRQDLLQDDLALTDGPWFYGVRAKNGIGSFGSSRAHVSCNLVSNDCRLVGADASVGRLYHNTMVLNSDTVI